MSTMTLVWQRHPSGSSSTSAAAWVATERSPKRLHWPQMPRQGRATLARAFNDNVGWRCAAPQARGGQHATIEAPFRVSAHGSRGFASQLHATYSQACCSNAESGSLELKASARRHMPPAHRPRSFELQRQVWCSRLAAVKKALSGRGQIARATQ